jgi:hypothetical protein
MQRPQVVAREDRLLRLSFECAASTASDNCHEPKRRQARTLEATAEIRQCSVHKLATVWLATPDPHRKEDRQGPFNSDTRKPAMRRSTRRPERGLRTRRRRPPHCTRCGVHSARGGYSAPHAAVGLPRTGQSLGHGRALPPALTNTAPDAGSTVPSCQQTACRCEAPADLPVSRAQRAMPSAPHAAVGLPRTGRSRGTDAPCNKH